MGFLGFGRKKREEELQEVDMGRGPPRVLGAPPIERPVTVTEKGEGDDYEEMDAEEVGMEDIDMADTTTTAARPPPALNRATEIPMGKPGMTFEIRKRLWRGRPGTEVIDTVIDSEPPNRQYIEEELKGLYGGGLYMVYHNDRVIGRHKIEGVQRWQEEVEAEQRKKEATMDDGTPMSLQGLMWHMMKRTDTELAAIREENAKLRDAQMKAQLEAIRTELTMMRENSGMKAVREQLRELKEFQEFLPGYKDPMDKILDNPMVQKSINTFIEKASEVDWSNTALFQQPPPGAQPGMPTGAAAPPPQRNDYIASIQQMVAQRKANIPLPIIERAVDIALVHPDEDPNRNLGNATDVLSKLLDARRALAHLDESVIRGKSSDEDAAKFIVERFPAYAQYLLEHDHNAMVEFLDLFNDLPKMQEMITYVRRDDVKAHVENIIRIIRGTLNAPTTEKKPEVILQDMPRIEERP